MAQPTIVELVTRIKAAAALLPYQYAAVADVAKVYEAYVWTLTVEAVVSAGHAKPRIVNDVAGVIKLRGAPIRISTKHTYAEFPDAGLEVHANVRVRGRSGVCHELDVGVLHSGPCDKAREGSALCSHHAALGVEVKCYDKPLGLDVGRGMLGLNSDTRCPVQLVTNTRAPKVATMLEKRTKAARLLPSVSPNQPSREEEAVNALAAFV
jgi:hypothetical protein